MCPDRKLRYFQNMSDMDSSKLAEIHSTVVDTWMEHYSDYDEDRGAMEPLQKKIKVATILYTAIL